MATATLPATLLVKIHDLEPSKGYTQRRYLIGAYRFYEGRGWYTVERKLALYLKEQRTNPGDLRSMLVFVVATPGEAEAIEEAEVIEVGTPDSPVSLPSEVQKRLTADAKKAAQRKGRRTADPEAPKEELFQDDDRGGYLDEGDDPEPEDEDDLAGLGLGGDEDEVDDPDDEDDGDDKAGAGEPHPLPGDEDPPTSGRARKRSSE